MTAVRLHCSIDKGVSTVSSEMLQAVLGRWQAVKTRGRNTYDGMPQQQQSPQYCIMTSTAAQQCTSSVVCYMQHDSILWSLQRWSFSALDTLIRARGHYRYESKFSLARSQHSTRLCRPFNLTSTLSTPDPGQPRTAAASGCPSWVSAALPRGLPADPIPRSLAVYSDRVAY